MDLTDETVVAYHSCRDLLRLYDTYRATSQGQLAVIARTRRQRDRLGDTIADPEGTAQLEREEALARHFDSVMALRSDQLRRRLLELLDMAEQP